MNETELLKQNVENKQQMTNSLRSIELQVRRSTEEAMNTMDGPRGSNLQARADAAGGQRKGGDDEGD